jgi:dTDP-4-amino-4,6-dideoxygalactose transaminase
MFIKKKIPVSKTNLPKHSDIYPYLQDINNDDSSFGKRPLLEHLKYRFQQLFNSGDGTISIMSNACIALANTLKATGAKEGTYCLMPSFCSPSIPFAATYAGLKPYFIDVDQDTWTLNPQSTIECLMYVKENIGAVVAPSAFGETIEAKKWDDFTYETGIPVVVGASNSFDSIIARSAVTKTPIVVGFNNYSLLSFGDGGIVVSKDNELIKKIENLNYLGSNDSANKLFIGTNGIMSEYNAAVCHAALDSWESTRAKWSNLNSLYIETLIETTLQHRLSFEFISSTCNIYLLGNNADSTIDFLKTKGIEATKWLGNGCHNMKEFKKHPRTSLDVTKNLISSVIGIPFYLELTKKDIEHIIRTLSSNVYGKKKNLRKV